MVFGSPFSYVLLRSFGLAVGFGPAAVADCR
jgi:hypothetical protein